LIISFVFARTISKPLRILTQRVSSLAQGNLDDPVKLDQKDEIGVLADHFELSRAKEAAEAILDKSPVPVAVVDAKTASYLRVNDAMTEFHKLSAAELLKRSTLETYANPDRDRPVIFEMMKNAGRRYSLQA